MEIAPDESERARSAVAVSCLRWLEYAGRVATEPRRLDPRTVRRMLGDEAMRAAFVRPPAPAPDPVHPLWDRWLDG